MEVEKKSDTPDAEATRWCAQALLFHLYGGEFSRTQGKDVWLKEIELDKAQRLVQTRLQLYVDLFDLGIKIDGVSGKLARAHRLVTEAFPLNSEADLMDNEMACLLTVACLASETNAARRFCLDQEDKIYYVRASVNKAADAIVQKEREKRGRDITSRPLKKVFNMCRRSSYLDLDQRDYLVKAFTLPVRCIKSGRTTPNTPPCIKRMKSELDTLSTVARSYYFDYLRSIGEESSSTTTRAPTCSDIAAIKCCPCTAASDIEDCLYPLANAFPKMTHCGKRIVPERFAACALYGTSYYGRRRCAVEVCAPTAKFSGRDFTSPTELYQKFLAKNE